MAFDTEDDALVLFGGEHFNGLTEVYYNDTWTYVAGTWTNVSPAHAPSPRFGFQLADDPADGCLLLFGGENAAHDRLNDTWEYAGGRWTNVSGLHAPPPRFWGSMSFDTALSEVLLFGGNEGESPSEEYSNDTWTFYDDTWAQLAPVHSPSGRDGEAQVDDVADDEVLLLGGLNETYYLNDTWSFSGGSWSATSVGHGPDPASAPGLAYDAAAEKVVEYGGYPASDDYYTTWVFSAGTWTPYTLSVYPPAGTTWGQMAYDVRDQVVVLFQANGMYNGTWTLNFSTGPTPPLTVSVGATPTTANVNQSVSFVSTVTGGVPPYSFHWVFADGTGASVQNTSHAFSTVGTYDVTLYVNDSNHTSASQEVTVSVQHPGGASGPPTLEYLLLGAVVAVVGIILAVVIGRRRKPRPAPPEAPPTSPAEPPSP